MTVDIRQAEPSDLAAIVDITRRAYAVWLPVLGYAPLPVTEDYAPRIARGEIWLGCPGERAAALIVVERAPDHDMIFSVAVDPARSGQGLGRCLIAFAEQRARDAGLEEMRLYTNARMAANIAFYGRLGYVETARRPNPARPGFTIVDMAKRL